LNEEEEEEEEKEKASGTTDMNCLLKYIWGNSRAERGLQTSSLSLFFGALFCEMLQVLYSMNKSKSSSSKRRRRRERREL
jgi:hypothetical protein